MGEKEEKGHLEIRDKPMVFTQRVRNPQQQDTMLPSLKKFHAKIEQT